MSAAGYMFTYYNSKVTKEREAQIDRVNAQVPPLPATTEPLPACAAGGQVLHCRGNALGPFADRSALCKSLSSRSSTKIGERHE